MKNLWFVDRDGTSWPANVVDGLLLMRLSDAVYAQPSMPYAPILLKALQREQTGDVKCVLGCTGEMGTLVGNAKGQANNQSYVAGWITRIAKEANGSVILGENHSGKVTMVLDTATAASEFDFDRVEALGERIKDMYDKGDDAKKILDALDNSSGGGDCSGESCGGTNWLLWAFLIGAVVILLGIFGIRKAGKQS